MTLQEVELMTANTSDEELSPHHEPEPKSCVSLIMEIKILNIRTSHSVVGKLRSMHMIFLFFCNLFVYNSY